MSYRTTTSPLTVRERKMSVYIEYIYCFFLPSGKSRELLDFFRHFARVKITDFFRQGKGKLLDIFPVKERKITDFFPVTEREIYRDFPLLCAD